MYTAAMDNIITAVFRINRLSPSPELIQIQPTAGQKWQVSADAVNLIQIQFLNQTPLLLV